MNCKAKTFLTASLTLAILLSLLPLLQNVVAQAAPSVFVNPVENFFYTDTTTVGTEFDVTIEAAGWPDPGVMSFEFKLRYDPTMLEPVLEKTNIDSEFWITEFIVRRGFDLDVDPPQPFEDAEGPYLLFASSFLGAKGATGDGILAKAGFQIIAEPSTGQTLSCDLEIADILVLNPSAQPYAEDYYEVQSGIYQFISPPPPSPTMKASSHSWDMDEAEAAGRLFDITVSINDLLEDWHLIGIQFHLEFDTALLSTKQEWVTEGDFLTQFGGTFSINYTEGDNVIYGQIQLPPWPGDNGWARGSGTVATIQFEATFIPRFSNAGCNLTLFNVILVDVDGVEIPCNLEHGRYDITLRPIPLLKVSSHSWDMASAEAAGRLFDITVSINDLLEDWHLIGIQFHLEFDTALLSTKQEWVTEGDFLTQFGGTFSINYTEGDNVIYGQIQLPPWPGDNGWARGSGTVATIQFEATFIPPPAADCDLTLFNVIFVDNSSEKIPYNLEHGHYTITVAPPPWLSVEPQDVELRNVGDTFNLNVAINELDAGFRLVGSEFKISYDNTLLSITEDDITEGVDNIMREVADRIGEGLFFQAYVEEEYGLIGIIILPLPDGTWPFFPEGTGLLATLKFTAIAQAEDVDIETDLELFDYLLVDSDAKEIAVDQVKTEQFKTCTCTLRAAVPEIPQHPDYPYSVDLYTQYDSPYGGQGYDRPSDAFAPQAAVQLLAEVTYFGDGVPGKPVSYVIDGAGGIDYTAVAMTNDKGVAVLDYIMPFSEDAFGLWAVQASWQVGSKIVTDYLVFRVDWLVCVKDVELTPITDYYEDTRYGETYPVYLKGESYDLSMDLEIMTMQHPGDCMAKILEESGTTGIWTKVTIFDELGQPAAFNQLDLTDQLETIPYDPDFVVFGTSRIEQYGPMSITIRPAAFSGRASVQANVLTDDVGVAYCAPTIKYIWIWKSPVPEGVKPTLTISSHSWTSAEADATDGVFEITVTISDVDPDLNLVALQFKLNFDCDLEVISVTEGAFIPQFGETFFVTYVEDGVLAAEIQLPPWPGANGWMRGDGTVATIQFKDSNRVPVSCDLTLDAAETFLSNSDNKPIDFEELIDGLYEIVP